MSGDLDALLAQAEIHMPATGKKLAAAVRTLRQRVDSAEGIADLHERRRNEERRSLNERRRKAEADYDTALDVIAMREDHCVSREPDGWWWLKVGMDFEDWPKIREVTDAERVVFAAAETRHQDNQP